MQRPTVVAVSEEDTVLDLDMATEPIHDPNLAATLRRLSGPDPAPGPRREVRPSPDWAVFGLD
jgi:hypothetical protein